MVYRIFGNEFRVLFIVIIDLNCYANKFNDEYYIYQEKFFYITLALKNPFIIDFINFK